MFAEKINTMKNKLLLFFISMLFSVSFCAYGNISNKSKDLTKYIDPYIGTGGHGHTFLGVSTPFGAVQVGPNNIYKGWDWSSGYHYSDSIIIGFSHFHLNGTGCSDTGDLLLMPYTGKEQTERCTQQDITTGYGSFYSHKKEHADVGYYAVDLTTYGVKAELTASNRVAYHRYTFPKKAEKYVMINLKEANGDDKTTDAFLEQVDEKTIRGYRFSSGWTKNQKVFFTIIFSKPISLKLYDDKLSVNGKSLRSINAKANVILFSDVSKIDIKVGISPVSMENAALNIYKEIPHWNFKKIVSQTKTQWNNELNKIKISDNDEKKKRTFYTAIYHAFLQPTLFSDVNSDYRGSDKKIYRNADFVNYTVFSLWDTYRAAHPLYTILQPNRVPDFINSFLKIYDQTGMLPVWHLYGGDTYEMIGIQSIPVICDAILKNFPNINYEKAFEAMKQSMLSNYKGLEYVRTLGYIPSNLEKESVAKALEYAISDGEIAQVALKLNKKDDYKLFMERSKSYKKYWDKNLHFFRGKDTNGNWSLPFNPIRSLHRSDDYCEGNAWQYTWLVPHDVNGLIDLFGGKQAFLNKLDSLFTVNDSLGEDASPDISGLIGQYAHGNEPGHHTVYLYTYAGEQWKTAEKVRYILSNMYHDTPEGLQGNEDCGQMSSWYIFSAMGFYPVNPSAGIYIFGSPLFDKLTISLPQNKELKIIAENNSDKNIYIQSVTLNGVEYNKTYITHKDIMDGGVLKFKMGNIPNYNFGEKQNQIPDFLK